MLQGQPRDRFVAPPAHHQDRRVGRSGQQRVEGGKALEVEQAKIGHDGRNCLTTRRGQTFDRHAAPLKPFDGEAFSGRAIERRLDRPHRVGVCEDE